MPEITSSTWKMWLTTHPSNHSYSTYPSRVRDLGAGSDPIAIFDRLTKHKHIGVISKAQFGTKLQFNYFFSTVGVPIMKESIRHTVRTNV